jgi:hypothetical protein
MRRDPVHPVGRGDGPGRIGDLRVREPNPFAVLKRRRGVLVDRDRENDDPVGQVLLVGGLDVRRLRLAVPAPELSETLLPSTVVALKSWAALPMIGGGLSLDPTLTALTPDFAGPFTR